MEGDVKGPGLGVYDASLGQCTKDCKERGDCNAFEHSMESDRCKLLEDKLPNGPKYEDYQLCVKLGNYVFTILSCIITLNIWK